MKLNKAPKEPPANAPRCCWLDDNQRMCQKKADQRKIIFSDAMSLSHGDWYWVPVCQKHR